MYAQEGEAGTYEPASFTTNAVPAEAGGCATRKTSLEHSRKCEAIIEWSIALRLDEIGMIVAAGRGFAVDIRDCMEAIQADLQSSGATRLLVSLDVCQTQLAAASIGIVSLYESRLQTILGWNEPFRSLKSELTNRGEPALANQLETIYLAVNTLKHGTGRSHNTLLSQSAPDVTVRKVSDTFYPEGDVCPNPDLVQASPQFLETCCDFVEFSWAKVKP